MAHARRAGSVAIVGAGPGDPDLLTLRALHALQQADVVLHDELAGREVLNYARRDAELIYVGKQKAHHSKSQDEINALMVQHAHAGKRVVRLKGGDPTIVVYMGLSAAGTVRDRLLAAGLASSTPVAIVENGSRPDQKVSVGTLGGLTALAARHTGGGPALMIIGEVAALAEVMRAAALAEAS
jgi:siroheme synthase